MKKNRIFAIVALLAVIVSSVVVFQACKKNEPVNNIANKKPIAVKNTKTGEITYNVELSKIQSKIDEFTKSKGGDEILVESWGITEDGMDNSPVLRFSIIDTENESSEKIGLYNSYIDKIYTNDLIEYYLSDYVISGNYTYFTSDGMSDYLITVENFEVVSVEILSEKSQRSSAVQVTCTTEEHCVNQRGCFPTDSGCSPCETGLQYPNEYYKCTQTASGTFSCTCIWALK